MFIKVDLYTFRQQFESMNRGATFSYEGQALLFEYLEEADHNGELDVIALCCDFAESSAEDIARDYNQDLDGLSEDEVIETVREYLGDEGMLVGETDSGNFVYRQH